MFLCSFAALGSGCFSPESDALQDEGGLMGTGASDDEGGTGDADDSEDEAPPNDGGGTGGQDSGEPDPAIDGGSDDSGSDGQDDAQDDNGESEGESEGEDGDESGIACEAPLGSEAHCLDCDDACDQGDRCTAQGCATPTQIGFSEPFTGVGGYPNRLWGYAVQMEQASVLSALNFHAVGNGGDVQLALYTDDGGAPDQLLAMTDVIGDYGPGTHAIPTEPVGLAAGTYWVMARNDFPSQIGLNFDPDILPPFPLTSVFIDFDAPMPEQLVGTETFNSYEVNVWVSVLEP